MDVHFALRYTTREPQMDCESAFIIRETLEGFFLLNVCYKSCFHFLVKFSINHTFLYACRPRR